MELFHAIETRSSIRKFTEEPVSPDILTQIVDMARHAPSWKNSQTAGYIAISDPAIKETLATDCCYGHVNNGKIIRGCPTLVVVTTQKGICGYNDDGTPSTSKGDGWEMFDAGVAAQTFSLAAHSLGLGSVILGIFQEEKVKSLLNLPENVGISTLIPLGYPAREGRSPVRKEVSELLSFR